MTEILKHGKCPFTGKPYDCGRCDVHKSFKGLTGPHTIHMNLYFKDAIQDGLRGVRWLKKVVGGKYTLDEVRAYFTELFMMGATCVPIGDLCDRFCFRAGCQGHPSVTEGKKKGETK